MVTNEKRNYFEMIGRVNNGFCENGWADGYADFDSDEEEIIRQLYGVVDDLKIVDYVSDYLRGYEVGKDMSEMASEIYDEDGCFREDIYEFSAVCCYDDIIKKKILEIKRCKT